MSSSRFAFLLLYLSVFANFLLQTAFGANPLYHFCSNTGNFSVYSPYAYNLKMLTVYLSIEAPPSGFAVTSQGQEENEAHGLALCRGDVKTPDCKTCVVEAGNEIQKRCPYSKGAIIWYDNCLLKYSNEKFFGQIDRQIIVYMWNVNFVKEAGSFNQKTKQLLSQLASEAYGASPNMYASGEMVLYGDQKLYGLTQCSRDLSLKDCNKCLEDIINQLPSCCDGKEGGRVIEASCNFRYEIYPFVNA